MCVPAWALPSELRQQQQQGAIVRRATASELVRLTTLPAMRPQLTRPLLPARCVQMEVEGCRAWAQSLRDAAGTHAACVWRLAVCFAPWAC